MVQESVRTVSLEDIVSDLPPIKGLDVESFSKRHDVALFITALGFEERCLTIPQSLSAAGFKSTRSLCFLYNTNKPDNEGNRIALAAALDLISPGAVTFRDLDPTRIREVLLDCLENLRPSGPGLTAYNRTVVFDISVASTRLILAMLSALSDLPAGLVVLYAEAGTYFPTEDEFKRMKMSGQTPAPAALEEGLSDVSVSPDHGGETVEIVPDCVVVLPNFNRQRALSAIARVDPALITNMSEPGTEKVIWVLGDPHHKEDEWRIQAVREINSVPIQSAEGESVVHLAETFDYRKFLRVLEGIYRSFGDTNRLTVVPLGSKLQSLGLSLFCRIHPDVRIITSAPKSYNAAHYTKGCKETWEIDFQSLPELSSKLSRVGKLEIIET